MFFSDYWSAEASEINDFVRLRGDIAHNGRDIKYVYIEVLKGYKDIICESAIESDNALADYLKSLTGLKKPWRAVSQRK